MSRVERHSEEETRKGKRGLTPFGRFLDILGTVIMAAAIVVSLMLAVPRFAGIQTYVVVSGSMEPAIPVGSLVYSKEAEPSTLETGDVIVFYSTDAGSATVSKGANGAIPITHRVVENHKDSGEIITKGDANESADLFPVAYANVEGKVLMHIPGLGILAAPLASAMGKIAVAIIILAGYLLTEAGNRMRRQ